REASVKGGPGNELNGNRRPVRGGEERPAFEKKLQVQIDFTIAPVYPVTNRAFHHAGRERGPGCRVRRHTRRPRRRTPATGNVGCRGRGARRIGAAAAI